MSAINTYQTLRHEYANWDDNLDANLNELLKNWEKNPVAFSQEFDNYVNDYIELSLLDYSAAEQIAKRIEEISPSGYSEFLRKCEENINNRPQIVDLEALAVVLSQAASQQPLREPVNVFRPNYASLALTKIEFESWCKRNRFALNKVKEINLLGQKFFSVPLEINIFPRLERLYLSTAQLTSTDSLDQIRLKRPDLQVYNAVPLMPVQNTPINSVQITSIPVMSNATIPVTSVPLVSIEEEIKEEKSPKQI